MDIEEHLTCPDCEVKLGLQAEGHLKCGSCGRLFPMCGSFINLLPAILSKEDQAEEHFWASDSKEGLKACPSLTLRAKEPEISFVREKILPSLKLTGAILEIGSGACWLSALVKKASPRTFVVASDVSPTALRKGEDVSTFMSSRIDRYVACKIENLPFEENLFDYVIGSAVLHHTEPQRAVGQIFKVLRRGGKFIGTGEPTIPKALSFAWKSTLTVAGRREKELGVKEGSHSLGHWKRYFYQAGFEETTFSSRMYPQYKQASAIVKAYYQVTSHMPQTVVMSCLPCVVVMAARK